MSLSFEETVKALAAKRKIPYETAELLVAERYGRVVDEETDVEGVVAFDDPDSLVGLSLYQPPAPRGRIVKMDADLSPKMAVERTRRVAADKAEGDRYRNMSRRTSMHDPS